MTGESWHEIMFQLEQAEPSIDYECINRPTYADYEAAGKTTIGCGYGMAVSRGFFVLYVFTVSIVLVNLFVAVTL